jgi:hypothetical protein
MVKTELAIIIILGCIFFIIDVCTFSYCNKKAYPILLIHHIINIFAQFGFLFNDKTLLTIYVFAPILTMIHWKTNNNKCVLTQIVNEMCGYDMYFRDIWFLMGLKNAKYYSEIHYSYLIVGWIIAIVKLRNSFNKSPSLKTK